VDAGGAARADQLQYEANQGPCLDAIWEQDTFQIDDMTTEQRYPDCISFQADLERYESIPMNDSSGMLHVIIRGARVFGEAGDAFTADIGVAANQGVSTRSGSPRAIVTGVIAELGDLRVFSPMEAVDGNGLTTVPLPSHAVKEGDTVDLPPRSQCVLQVGQPVELMLLRPGAPGGRYRVERILRYER